MIKTAAWVSELYYIPNRKKLMILFYSNTVDIITLLYYYTIHDVMHVHT